MRILSELVEMAASLLFLLLITGACSLGISPSSKSSREAFKEWQMLHLSTTKRLRGGNLGRYKAFQTNLKYVNKLASHKDLGFQVELNQFADKSEKELDSYVSLNVTKLLDLEDPPSSLPSSLSSHLSSSSVPKSVDHRLTTGLTRPRHLNLIHCGGGSWSFSVVAAVEARYTALTNEMPLLSEQELLDCSYQDGSNSCKGGYMTAGYQYLLREGRLADRRFYPTYGSTGICLGEHLPNGMTRAGVMKYWRVPTGEENLMREVSGGGPVSVGIRADKSLYFYKRGIYDQTLCWGGSINHAVTAVGYQPDYWIIKNCWGTSWGDMQGYAYLGRKYGNPCKIADYPVAVNMALKGQQEDWCPHVPFFDRETCWSNTDYSDVWNQQVCETNDCCWDETTKMCYVKAKITLYEKRNFEGVSATFYGSIPDLKQYGLSQVVHSVKVHYGNFMVYNTVNYGEKGNSWDSFSLGVLYAKQSEFPNLDDYSFSHDIVSIRALSSGADVITLFVDTAARGAARAIYRQAMWVGPAWNDKFSSIFTTGNSWMVCKKAYFGGDCKSIGWGKIDNLDEIGLNDEISSVLTLS